MDRVVKKFGGTSLRTEKRINLAVDEVAEDLEAGNAVVSVVSAMGTDGDPYATDTLIGLMEEVSSEVDPLKKDLIMSCGEVISASLFSHYLDSVGYDSIPMTGHQAGIFTDRGFGDARIVGVDPSRMENYLNQKRPVVLAGFQGRTIEGEITTLGRGGSDTTALRVGGSVGAELVEIYTDVPGVAVVNPELVENPPFFSSVPRDALLFMAKNGAAVIHPRAVAAAAEYDVPFSIKCSWVDGEETAVNSEPSSEDTPLGIAVLDGCSMVELSCSELESISESVPKSGTIRIDKNDGTSFLLSKEAEFDPAGHDARHVSLVTAVPTLSTEASEITDRIVGAVEGEIYLEKKVSSSGVQFVVEPGEVERVVRVIYDLFY
ncbi:aspartate kinase [Candidatus Bipolaricaulota bacterium]|nr:aspartate kinase [Candidatus Bipolaricaulota bacterium]